MRVLFTLAIRYTAESYAALSKQCTTTGPLRTALDCWPREMGARCMLDSILWCHLSVEGDEALLCAAPSQRVLVMVRGKG